MAGKFKSKQINVVLVINDLLARNLGSEYLNLLTEQFNNAVGSISRELDDRDMDKPETG